MSTKKKHPSPPTDDVVKLCDAVTAVKAKCDDYIAEQRTPFVEGKAIPTLDVARVKKLLTVAVGIAEKLA